MSDTSSMCPCQSEQSFQICCEPLLNKKSVPASPLALMRSRYTAFCLKNLNYLQSTTDPETAPHFDWEANRNWADSCRFTNLKVLNHSEEGNLGHVEFIARYVVLQSRKSFDHHEFSTFRKHLGHWYYSHGRIKES